MKENISLILPRLLSLGTAFLIMTCGLPVSDAIVSEFEAREKPLSITVLPVRVVAGQAVTYDDLLGQDVLDYLQQTGIAEGELSNESIEFPAQWHSNQAKMLKESGEFLAEQIKLMEFTTDYVFQVELLCNAQKTHVGGIHLYLLTSEGEFVDVRLNNSHWEEYQAVNPESPEDGIEVMKLMIANNW